MAISKNREKGDESPSHSDDTGPEKPKSSAGRKVVLLLLLLATIVVVGLEYLPEGDSEPQVVGPPAKKLRAPVRPQQQQRSAPLPGRPAPVPTPTPPQYEKPGETLFVSNSPSDAPALATPAVMSPDAAAGAETSTPAAAPAPAMSPTLPTPVAAEKPTEPAKPAAPEVPEAPVEAASKDVADTPVPGTPAEPLPSAEVPAAPAAPPAAEVAAMPTETAPTQAATEPSTNPAEPASEPASPTPVAIAPVTSAPAPELVASRSPATSTLPVQDDTEVVIVAGPSATSSQAVARPLPDVAIPAKVDRYARRLFSRYDTNGDGAIDDTERRQMQGNPAAVDYNADGQITLEELAAYTADFGRHRRMRLTGSMVEEAVAELPPLYIPAAEREAMAAAQAAAQQAAQLAAQQATQQAQTVPVALVNETAETGVGSTGDSEAAAEEEGSVSVSSSPTPGQTVSKRFVTPKSRLAGLPEWFSARDMNGDGQLTVAEYTPGSEESLLAQFNRYDRNKDGVLTPQECPKQ